MDLWVEIRADETPIRRLLIENLTGRDSGASTYRWTISALDVDVAQSLFSAQQGLVEHVYEDGTLALISEVAAAAGEARRLKLRAPHPTHRGVSRSHAPRATPRPSRVAV